MSRKAKPIELHLLENNKNRLTKKQIQERIDGQIHPNTNQINCPDWLDEIGRREWERITNELIELGLMTNIDVVSLGIYCDAYSKYVEATLQIQEDGLTVEHINNQGAKNTVTNPAVQVANKYADLIKKFVIEFGLTPSARAKLAIPKKEEKEPSKLDKMFGGV